MKRKKTMAKLLSTPYPFPRYERDFESYRKMADEALNAIPKGKLISFPVADGYAYYFVVSLSPLVLQHIDYMDGYEISPAYIRGLRKSDIPIYADKL
jgi:hypothetical protein